MELTIRKLNENDYQDILVGWWKDWGWDSFPTKDFLPENGTGGIILYDGDVPVCAGFIYNTNSKISWIDWIVSNKKYRKKPNRKIAINLLIEELTIICKNSGSKFVYSLMKSNNLVNHFLNNGYIKGSSYTEEIIKIL
jgi:hypothetical protein